MEDAKPCTDAKVDGLPSNSGDVMRSDTDRLMFLAGMGDELPVVDEFPNVLDDFYSYLGDVICERRGRDNYHIDTQETDDEKLEAFRRLVDASMNAKKSA
jgi:hypothetical protein